MKIISKHKDYYDNGMLYGIDEKVVFVRTIDLNKDKDEFLNLNFTSLPNSRLHSQKVEYQPFLVYFCGKTYVGYKIDTPI